MASERADFAGTAASAHPRARSLRERRRGLQTERRWLQRLLFRSASQLRREEDWEPDAEGEHKLAAWLQQRCPAVLMLDDRRAPGIRGTLDHIAIGPSGVHVIDCKRYLGKVKVTTPLFGEPKLRVEGRDRTHLIEGLQDRVERVRALLGDARVPVSGCLCFVAPEGPVAEVRLPLFGTRELNGYPLYYQRRLAKRLNADGPLTPARAHQLYEQLARALPRATGPGPAPDLAA